jgi:hypothetical protein
LVSRTNLEEIRQHVSTLTRGAFALLHHNAEDAYHAWQDGMLMVEGGWVAVTPTSVSLYRIDSSNGSQGSEPGLLISAEAGFSFNESAAARRLMQLSGYLLATFGTGVGCNTSGRLTLQRVVVARLTTCESLADEIVATRRLQRLLNEPYLGSDQ